MLPLHNKNTGGRLNMQEVSYYSKLMYMLEQSEPSKCQVKFKHYFGGILGGVTTWTVLGFIGFDILGAAIGCLIGALIGWMLGQRWASGHARMLSAMNALSEGEKVRLIGVVQGVVGGSSNIDDTMKLFEYGNSDKLVDALKRYLKIKII